MGICSRNKLASAFMGSTFLILVACDQPLDFDLRGLGGGFNTAGAAQQVTEVRPQADNRGVISYPNYQIVIARPGDKISDISERVGIPADELGRYNGIGPEVVLRANEVIALPRRVTEPSPATGAIGTGPIRPGSAIDITSLAGDAIDRAGETPAATSPTRLKQGGTEPVRHRVERGETAFSISRLYDVSVRALSDWNGLGPELTVRAGQFLLIPVIIEAGVNSAQPSVPGQGSVTPEPPSAATALPAAAPEPDTPAPPSPDLVDARTAASNAAQLSMPVNGNIIRSYIKGRNDGIDIAAVAGTAVLAAADGTVAAITRDTEQVPILVIKHADNMLTVYAGVDALTVTKGATVKRGQKIATVRSGDPSFLHFEVRQGLESVDPMQFLN
jgi:LysM repeat protein